MQFLTGLTSACTTGLVFSKPEATSTSSAKHGEPGWRNQRPQTLATTLLQYWFQYWYYLRIGSRWALATWQMSLYVGLLLPGFLQMVAFYIFSPRVAKNIRYGPGSRQLLDLYSPQAAVTHAAGTGDAKLPVVIYITGGAWLVGYKAWGAILARRLSQQGILVACIDHRNFPQACAEQMLEDVNTAVAWLMSNIEDHGGDAGNITLVGQSAGAHLGALALFKQAAAAADHATNNKVSLFATPRWSPKALRAFVALSGIYDLHSLAQHMEQRGFGRDLLDHVMIAGGRPALLELSPLEAARKLDARAVALLPGIALLHGTADKSSRHEGASRLYEVLKDQSINCDLQLQPGKGHTADLLEGPMRGGQDPLVELLVSIATGHAKPCQYPRLNPKIMCDIAGYVCPF